MTYTDVITQPIFIEISSNPQKKLNLQHTYYKHHQNPYCSFQNMSFKTRQKKIYRYMITIMTSNIGSVPNFGLGG